MKIIKDNAEKELLLRLKIIKARREALRCIFIREVSKISTQQDCLLEVIGEDLANQKVEVYLCVDAIFILASYIPFVHFNRMCRNVLKKCVVEGAFVEKNISLFDVVKDMERIKFLAEKQEIGKGKVTQDILAKEEKILQEGNRERIMNMEKEDIVLQEVRAKRLSHKTTVVQIVEDDRFMSELISTTVGSGCKKFISLNGSDAIDIYIREAPNLVFLDIELPDINGLDVLQKIKEIDNGAYIVIITGYGTHDNIVEAVKRQAKGFITKPFSKIKIERHVASVKEGIVDS